jgi:hypothetical protein
VPRQASVLLLTTAESGPGRVTYFIDFGRSSPLLKADLGGEASGERALGPYLLNIPSHMRGEHPIAARIVAPRNLPGSAREDPVREVRRLATQVACQAQASRAGSEALVQPHGAGLKSATGSPRDLHMVA